MNDKLINFIDLYFESAEENIEVVKKQLEESGIDYEKSLEDTKQLLKKQRAKLKLNKGIILKQKLKEFYERAKENNLVYESRLEFRFAHRKFEGVDEEDMKELEEDAFLLEEIDKFLKNGL